MIDIASYQGIGQLGPAYRAMLERDSHAPGSVDRVLLAGMVGICPETVAYLYRRHTPTDVDCRPGARPGLEACVAEATAGCGSAEERVAGIARFCACLAERGPEGLDEMLVGGTEEEIIERGSDWCTDVARVACALCQVAGVPARVVFLADTLQAYSGHVIIEAWRDGEWGAVDAVADVAYVSPEGAPATTGQLMQHADWLGRPAGGCQAVYRRPGQFRAAAVANYSIARAGEFDYTVSRPNDYYRSILAMSEMGWPGGRRWLHGEDKA